MNVPAQTPARNTRPVPAHLTRGTRHITAVEAAQVWAAVRQEIPMGTDRIKHGTLALCGYWTGSFTQPQLDEFNRRTQKLMRDARKAAKAAA